MGTIPYGAEESMAFSGDGMGYVAVSDGERGDAIYAFNPREATVEEYLREEQGVKGLAVDPTTGELWWVAGGEAVHSHAEGGRQNIPYFDDVSNGFLAFGADGTLYTLVWLQREGTNVPQFHGIFRYEDGDWVELVDMTAEDPGITLAQLAMCPDGHIHVSASIDGADVAPDRPHASMSSLLRLEDDNALALLGYDLGYFDPLAMACAPSGTVHFTNAQGIYSFPGLGARR